MRLIEKPLTISFTNSDLSNINYQIGAAQALRDYLKQPVIDQCVFSGSSWGAFVAVSLVFDLNLDHLRTFIDSLNALHDTRHNYDI